MSQLDLLCDRGALLSDDGRWALDPEPAPPADSADDHDVTDGDECGVGGCTRPPMPGRDWCMRHNR